MAINNAANYQVTQYNVVTGGANNLLNSVAPIATSGVPLCSNGTSAQPSFQTCLVGGGGTGTTSFTTYSLIASGTTSTGAFQSINNVATGSVLISQGTSTLPAWSTSPSITSITLGGGTTLSAYTEGTWTPTIVGTVSNPTVGYSAQVGRYNQTGNSVLLTCQVILTSISGGSGNAGIGSLPFTTANVSNQQYIYACSLQNVTITAGYLYCQGRSTENKTQINELDIMKSGTLLADVNITELSNTSYIWCSGWISLA